MAVSHAPPRLGQQKVGPGLPVARRLRLERRDAALQCLDLDRGLTRSQQALGEVQVDERRVPPLATGRGRSAAAPPPHRVHPAPSGRGPGRSPIATSSPRSSPAPRPATRRGSRRSPLAGTRSAPWRGAEVHRAGGTCLTGMAIGLVEVPEASFHRPGARRPARGSPRTRRGRDRRCPVLDTSMAWRARCSPRRSWPSWCSTCARRRRAQGHRLLVVGDRCRVRLPAHRVAATVSFARLQSTARASRSAAAVDRRRPGDAAPVVIDCSCLRRTE